MVYCSAVNCDGNSRRGTRLFRFPRDPIRRKTWVTNCRHDKSQWKPKDSSRLCEKHFEESDFEEHREDMWRKLKRTAVPTIFNTSDATPLIDAAEEIVRRKGRKRKIPPDSEESKTRSSAEILPKKRKARIVVKRCAKASRTNPNSAAGRKSGPGVCKSENDDVEEEEEEITFQWICDNGATLCSREWICYSNDDYACFGLLSIDGRHVGVKSSVSVSKILDVEVTYNGHKATLPPVSTAHVDTRQRLVMILDQVQTSQECCGISDDNLRSFIVKSPVGVREKSGVWRHKNCMRVAGESSNLCRPCEAFQHFLQRALRGTRKAIVPPAPGRKERKALEKVLEVKLEMTSEADNESRVTEEEESKRTKNGFELRDFDVNQEYDDNERNENRTNFDDSTAESVDDRKILANKEMVVSESEGLEFELVDDISIKTNLERTVAVLAEGVASGGPVRCELCAAPHESAELLAVHKMLVHPGQKYFTKVGGPTPYKCRQCDRSFGRLARLHDHYHRFHRTREFKCAQCGKCFPHNNNLKQHMEVHSDKCNYQCDVCGMGFKIRNSMMRHRHFHMKEKPHVCEHCGESFSYRPYLKLHLKRFHGIYSTGGRHVCDHCGMRFSYDAHLQKHLTSFSKSGALTCKTKKKLTCESCDILFAKISAFKEHMLVVHEDNYPFQCDMCDKRFKTNQLLGIHGSVHSEERPFICEQCGRGFKFKSKLKEHTKAQHSAVRILFPCKICGRQLSTKANLTVHMRIHFK